MQYPQGVLRARISRRLLDFRLLEAVFKSAKTQSILQGARRDEDLRELPCERAPCDSLEDLFVSPSSQEFSDQPRYRLHRPAGSDKNC